VTDGVRPGPGFDAPCDRLITLGYPFGCARYWTPADAPSNLARRDERIDSRTLVERTMPKTVEPGTGLTFVDTRMFGEVVNLVGAWRSICYPGPRISARDR
jgi:hypothetical protein